MPTIKAGHKKDLCNDSRTLRPRLPPSRTRTTMADGGRSTEVVRICFNVSSPDSLENIQKSGWAEKRSRCSCVQIIKEGNKKDLRNAPHTLRCRQPPSRAETTTVTGCSRITEVILICFNVTSPYTLGNIPVSGWAEKRSQCFGVPTIKAGNKKNLRNGPRTLRR
nr:uncharacterized protein LOC119176753 [Rhipicephalus microplus]